MAEDTLPPPPPPKKAVATSDQIPPPPPPKGGSPGKSVAPPAPLSPPSPSGSGASGSPFGQSGAGLPTAQSDPAAFAFNSAAILGEEPPVRTAEEAALAINAKRIQAIAAPARKKAPFVPVPQQEPETAPRPEVEQQYTPSYIEQKKAAGRWTAGDELRMQEVVAVNAAEALRQRRMAIAQKVDQQGAITPEDEQALALLDSDMNLAKEQYEAALKQYARSPEVASKEFMQSQADERYRQGGPARMAMEQFARPLGNSINSFVLNGLGGALRTLDAFGNIPNKITGDDEYYSPLAQAADWITEGLDYVSRTEPGKTKDGIFDEDWNVNSDALLPQFTRMGVYMAGLVGAGNLGGTSAMGLTSFLTTEEDYYREAIEAGLSPSEAQQFSMSAAAATASLEGINPQLYASGTIKGQMAKRALSALKNGESRKDAIKDAVKFVASEVGGENAQEFAQAGSDILARYLTNQSIGEDKLDASMTWQEAAETAIMTTALSGLVAGVARAGDRPLYQQSIEWAVNNPEQMQQYIQLTVPKDQQAPLLAELEKRVKIDRGLPPKVQGQQRREVASAVAEKERIKEEQSQASVDETVAAIAGDQFQQQLDAQDERIAAAMGIKEGEIEKKEEADRLIEQYEKAKLKSEITGAPMPEGMTKPKEVVLEPKIEPAAQEEIVETPTAVAEETITEQPISQTNTPESLTQPASQAEINGGQPSAIGGEQVGESIATAQVAEPSIPSPAATATPDQPQVGSPNAVETIEKPMKLARGQDGKRDADGLRINEHKGVNGLFATEDIKQAGDYGRVSGVAEIELPAGTTIETIRVGGSMEDLRPREIEAINASTADVVRLRTVDGDKSGEQVQYVLKNKALWPPKPAKAETKERIEEPPIEPPAAKEPSSPRSRRNEHATAKRFKEQHPEIYEVLNKNREEDIEYETLPNAVSIEAADQMVGYMGLESAEAAAFNESNGIPDAVRVMMMRRIIAEYEKRGENERAADVATRLMDYGLAGGQRIQAFTGFKENYTPAVSLALARRIVQEGRGNLPKNATKTAKKVKKAMDKANEGVINDVLLSAPTQAKINKVAVNPPYSAGGSAQSFGSEVRKAIETAKRKTITRKAAEDAFSEMGRMLNSGVPPQMVVIATYLIERGARTFAEVSKVVVKRLGRKALPYLKEAYIKANKDLGLDDANVTSPEEIDQYIAKANTDHVVKKFDKAIKSGKDKEAAEAIAELQQVSKQMGVWGLYQQEAADRLKKMAEKSIAEGRTESPPVEQFTQGLVRNMISQMRERAEEAGEELPAKARRPDIEIIGEAYKNPEKYKEVWLKTQNEFKSRLRAAIARLERATTPEAKQEAERAIDREETALAKLDAYYGELLPKPFSEAMLGRSVRDGLKEMNVKINEIIRQHYTVAEGAKRTLHQKLVQDAGLTEEQGAELARFVGREFDRLATERKRALIEQFVKRKTTKVERKKKGIEDEIILLTNTGALTDTEFLEKYAEIMDWPRIDKADSEQIVALANRVQESPEGRPRNEAISDLLSKLADLKGVSKWDLATSIWYAHMLSGIETQTVNILANFARQASEYAVATMRSPKDSINLARSLIYGYQRGVVEAASTLRTGYSPVRGKVEEAAVLERHKFKGPLKILNNHKYVQRFMRAADALSYEPLREMRAYQLAAKEARKFDPSAPVRQKALEMMNLSDSSIQLAKDQAEMEYEADLARINSNESLTKNQREAALNKARKDKRRRVFELVERKRPQDMLERSARFALAATYNEPPTGTLGAVARSVNGLLRERPQFRPIIPFVNVIANVLNDAINYTPIGLARAARGGSLLGGEKDFEKLSEEERADLRADLLAKGAISIVAFAALMAASEPGDDDEAPIEVTADGFGNYRDNQVLMKTGWRPYSIKVNGRWYSYQYTPLILLAGLVGRYRDSKKYRKKDVDKTEAERWTLSATGLAPTILDMSFLAETENILSGIASPANEDRLEDMGKSAAKSAKRLFIPALYDEFARNMEEAFDSPIRDVRDMWYGSMLKDIPGLRDNFPAMYDVLGDPVMPEARFMRRFQSPEIKGDDVSALIVEKMYPLRAPAISTPVYDPSLNNGEGGDREMTPKEREVFYRVRGATIRSLVSSQMDYLKELTPAEFADEMRTIQSDATMAAKDAVIFGDNP